MMLSLFFVCCLIELCIPLVKSQYGFLELPGLNLDFGTRQPPRNPGNWNSNNYERIVTSQAEIKSGVEPDYKFVETTTIGEKLSSPGCPKSILGIPWLYYKSRYGNRCYLAGSEGPCGRGQVFTPEPMSLYGYCNCLCPLTGSKTGLTSYNDSRLQFCKGARNKEIEIISLFEFVFIPRRKQCYQLYSQAFCDRGDWLVKTDENRLSCEPRKCVVDTQPYFEDKKWHCRSPPGLGSSTSSLSNSPCRNVMEDYVDVFGTCVFKVKYNFDD